MEYILGIAVSIVVEIIKKYGGIKGIGTAVALLIVSVIGGWLYTYYVGTNAWQTMIQAFVAAAAFHNLVIRNLEKS